VVKAVQQVQQPEGSARHGYAARNIPLFHLLPRSGVAGGMLVLLARV
jgi:hypothetical protein